MLELLSGHYDTTIGSKKEAASYVAIANEVGLPAEDMLFVSDVLEELDAAKTAGMDGVLSIRPGNKPIERAHGFLKVESFADIEI